ncbi:MAG: tyrosine-type recombinase/integrase [Dysgonomonas sp.]
MASIIKRGKGYRITVSNGRGSINQQILETSTFIPPPGLTKKQEERAVNLFAMHFEEKVKNGSYLDGEKCTFGEFADKWCEEYAPNNLELSTLSDYQDLLRIHILPDIGHIRLSKIQPPILNRLYNKLLRERKDNRDGGYSYKTVRNIHYVISSILHTALEWNVIAFNPCDRVRAPGKRALDNKIKFFTLEQSEQFLALLDLPYYTTVKAHDRVDDTGISYHVAEYKEKRYIPTQYRLFYKVALLTGMRRGEIIALEWTDIDFTSRVISVTKSTTTVNGKVVTKVPKTAGSERKISVPEFVIELFRQYKIEQSRFCLQLGSGWNGDNYIFIQDDGQQMHKDSSYKLFKKIIERQNKSEKDFSKWLPNIPLHGLRHTSATLLISQKVDIRTIAGRLGHTQTSTTTDIYGHFLQKADEAASDIMNDLFNQNKNVNQTLTNAKK